MNPTKLDYFAMKTWLGIPAGTNSIAAFAGDQLFWPLSVFAKPANGGTKAATRAIPVKVYKVIGSTYLDDDIRSRIDSALGYWRTMAGLQFTWDDVVVHTPNCPISGGGCACDSDDYILDMSVFTASSGHNDATAKIKAAYNNLQQDSGLVFLFPQNTPGNSAAYTYFDLSANKFTNFIIANPSAPFGDNILLETVLSHEMGHVFTLKHNLYPLFLMCGPVSANVWEQIPQYILCTEPTGLKELQNVLLTIPEAKQAISGAQQWYKP